MRLSMRKEAAFRQVTDDVTDEMIQSLYHSEMCGTLRRSATTAETEKQLEIAREQAARRMIEEEGASQAVEFTTKLANAVADLDDSLSTFRQNAEKTLATSKKRKIDMEEDKIQKKLLLLDDIKRVWESKN
jgi:hypothetical protein